MFVALNNLRTFNNSLNDRTCSIIINGRSNYSVLVPSVKDESTTSTSIYLYYIDSGFASFWSNDLANAPTTILNNINNVQKTGTITTYGVSLPNATISYEPLLCSVFELNSDPKLMALAKQVYLAHEGRYNATGKYVAFSEGNTCQVSFTNGWYCPMEIPGK